MSNLTKFIFVIICILLLIQLISWKINFENGVLIHGDFSSPVNSNKNIFDIVTTWSENYFGENQTNNLFLYFPENFLQYLLSLFLPLNIVTYLFFVGPIFFVALLGYLFFSKLSSSWIFGILSSIFLVSNNLFVEYFIFGGNYFFVAEIALLLLLDQVIIKKNKDLSVRQIIIISLISLIISHLFFLFIYILIFGIVSIFNNKKNLIKILLAVIFIALLNSFILLPFIQGSVDRPPLETYQPVNLNNVLMGFVNTTSYVYHTSLYHYGGFVSQNIFSSFNQLFYIFLLIFAIFTILFLNRNKLVLLSSLVFLIFFIFSLGPVGVISGKIFEMCFNNLSWFGFFRSFPRFLIIIPILYLVFVSLFFRKIKPLKNISRGFLILFIIFIFGFHFAAFSGDFSGYVKAYEIPQEYFSLDKEFILDNQQFSILSLPTNDYENYFWTTPNTSEFRQSYYLMDSFFSKPVVFERASLQLKSRNDLFKTIFESPCSANFIDSLQKTNIKYILLHKDKMNVFSRNVLNPVKIKECIEEYADLIKISENNYFILYKFNKSSQILLSDELINFKRINSTKYIINLKIRDANATLIFLQNFNSNFKLFLTPFKKIDGFEASFLDKESIIKSQFFEGDEIRYLWENPVFDDNNHKIIYDYANSWEIDADYIKSNFSKEYYYTNPDGSIEINLVLYFRPQSYFYLGLFISGFILFGCLIYLFFDWQRNNIYLKKI